MKIIFICTRSITFNTFLKSQAEYFAKKGFEVEVACSDIKNINLEKNLKHFVNFPNKISNLFNIKNYFTLRKQIRNLVKKNPGAIFYLHTPVASHFFRYFNFFNKLKIIYFVHGFRFTSKSNFIKKFFFKSIENILSIKTNIFITINNEDYNYAKLNLINKNSSCHKIKGVGLDLNKRDIKDKKEIKKILVIAAYKKEKGYLDILKVAEMLKNHQIKIICYGSGDYRKFNLIKSKKELNNIFFNNFDKNLSKKIWNFDLLLHLSKREGLPVSVMQSLINGLPIICYNIRGNNDLVTDKNNGYFVKTYKEVVNKIHYLNLENKIFNEMRITASKSIDRDFSRKNINLKLFKIIRHFQKS